MNDDKRVSIGSTKQKREDLANECVNIDPSTKYLLTVPAPSDEDDPRRFPRAVAPKVALGIVNQIAAWANQECPFERRGGGRNAKGIAHCDPLRCSSNGVVSADSKVTLGMG
jgi:hypothetical protein